MENPEEVLHSLEEFTKTKPKDIPRELEDYLCFVAKTGDPVYQWSAIKSLFREKMINVITEFYETCPSVEIPPCPNVDLFNYDVMKNFILEKLDTFAAAPFTLQRICELLTTPRKEYNRIDKYMRALEKNILVVSTTEPGGRRNTENGEGIMNGLESEHLPETSNSSNDINVEEMDETPSWPRLLQNETAPYQNDTNNSNDTTQTQQTTPIVQETVVTASKIPEVACTSTQDTVITCRSSEEPYVSIEPVPSNTCARQENSDESDVSVTITAIPAGVQKRRSSIEPVVSSESTEEITESCARDNSGKSCDETSKEINTPQEDQETSSSQQEDADSSSNQESVKESTECKDDKTPDTSSPDHSNIDENVPQNDLSSTEEGRVENEVGTSEETKQIKDNSEIIECSEEVTVDTTKCSNLSPIKPSEEEMSKSQNEDVEITSSDKDINNEVHSSESELINTDEAKAKIEENQDEVNLLNSSDDDNDKIGESQNVDSIEIDKNDVPVKNDNNDDTVTPMEVDDDSSSSEKVEEVVKAEATSDSSL